MKTLHHPYLATVLLSLAAQAATADRLVDPTRPATAKSVAATEASSGVKVEAIMNSGAHPLAIVNGKVVRAGDFIGAVQIEAILSDGVRYKRDGRSQTALVGKQMIQVRHNVTAHADQP
jgi:hypothetical protein